MDEKLYYPSTCWTSYGCEKNSLSFQSHVYGNQASW